MPRLANIALVFGTLLVAASPAHANTILQLTRPYFACADKKDAEQLASLARQPLTKSAAERYGRAHCDLLQRGTVKVDRRDGVYACIRRERESSCAWVPAEFVRATAMDDGVF
jgi:hypothetical protein